MQIIKDLRILKKVEAKTHLYFDRKHRYCSSFDIDTAEVNRELAPLGFKLVYVDGCFEPFLTKLQPKA